jgi:hypothetical protein
MAIQLRGALQGVSISRFGVLFPSPGSAFLSGLDLGVFYDPIAVRLALSLQDIGFSVTKAAFGLGHDPPGSDYASFKAFPPHKPFKIPYNEGFDRRAYSNSVGDFFSVVEHTEFFPPPKVGGRPENQIRHVTSGGLLDTDRGSLLYAKNSASDSFGAQGTGLFSYPGPFSRYQISLPISDNVPFPVYDVGSSGANQFVHDFIGNFEVHDVELSGAGPFPNTDGSPGSTTYDLSIFIPGPYFGAGIGVVGFESEMSLLRPSRISYTLKAFDFYYGVNSSHRESSIDVVWNISYLAKSASEGVPDPNYPPVPFYAVVADVEVDICRLVRTDNPSDNITFTGWRTEFEHLVYHFESSDCVLLTTPTPLSGWDDSPLLDLFLSRRGDLQTSFYLDVVNDMPNIRPSSFHAVRDAVDTYANVIETNHIETLKEIDDLLHLIPSFGKLAEFASSLSSGSAISAGKHGLDFLSDTYLRFKFGIEPTVKNGQEILNKASAVRERFANLYGPRTLNGKFHYVFPEGTYGFRNVSLTTRAKIRIHFDESCLLAGVLRSRALGLFPSLSSLWDCVPLSFIIDWFTNLGERFDSVDDQVSILAFRITECVYSYTVYVNLDEELLQSFDLTAAEPNHLPYLKCYTREVSHIKPLLRDSKYDWLAPQKVPDLGIVGSLLWKVLS